MKKLVLAIGLVIASSVNVFGQIKADDAFISYHEISFLETYNIDIQSIDLSDSIPDITSYFIDKVNNRGNNESFNDDVDLELHKFNKVTGYKVIGFKSIDVTEYSEVIKKIEIFKLRSLTLKDSNKQYTINSLYIVYQDIHGKWYSSNWLQQNRGYHF